MKKGLVLEGGGMRGLFTCGVIDEMMERGILYDGMVGVSAGAAFGCNYKSRQIGRVIRYQLALRHNLKYMGLWAWLTTGDYVSGDYAYHYMPKYLDYFDIEAFADNPMEFHVVCTDAVTGQPVYRQLDHIDYDALQWIRASASLPIVSRPVPLEGRLLLDGGMVDAIPLAYFESLGYEKNVVVLTQPEGFRKEQAGALWTFRTFMKKYPKVIEAMEHRHEMYNRQLDYLLQAEHEGRCLIIYPSQKLDIGRVSQNATKMRQCYDAGRVVAKQQMDRIIDFLNQ